MAATVGLSASGFAGAVGDEAWWLYAAPNVSSCEFGVVSTRLTDGRAARGDPATVVAAPPSWLLNTRTATASQARPAKRSGVGEDRSQLQLGGAVEKNGRRQIGDEGQRDQEREDPRQDRAEDRKRVVGVGDEDPSGETPRHLVSPCGEGSPRLRRLDSMCRRL